MYEIRRECETDCQDDMTSHKCHCHEFDRTRCGSSDWQYWHLISDSNFFVKLACFPTGIGI